MRISEFYMHLLPPSLSQSVRIQYSGVCLTEINDNIYSRKRNLSHSYQITPKFVPPVVSENSLILFILLGVGEHHELIHMMQKKFPDLQVYIIVSDLQYGRHCETL